MIPAAYSTALKNAIQAYSYADRVAIWRTVNQADGIGGVSQHWIQVAEIRGTISNTGDTEGVVGGMIEQSGTWTLTWTGSGMSPFLWNCVFNPKDTSRMLRIAMMTKRP